MTNSISALPTVSVGIPAHNEEGNIAGMLDSIFSQKGNFILKAVLVVCDGCTDKTAAIVKSLQKKYSILQLHDDDQRIGKANRLNQIYDWNTSEFLLSIDADVVLERSQELSLMLDELSQFPETNVVAGRLVPVKPTTLMGKFSYVSYLTVEEAALQLNQGSNYFLLGGSVVLLRQSFAKTFRYPSGVVSDQNYVFTMATLDNQWGMRLAQQSRVLFRTVSTFLDWRKLAARSTLVDKQNLITFFGTQVLRQYSLPKIPYFKALWKWLFIDPIGTCGCIGMNIFVRLFPLKGVVEKNGVWDMVLSTKVAINSKGRL